MPGSKRTARKSSAPWEPHPALARRNLAALKDELRQIDRSQGRITLEELTDRYLTTTQHQKRRRLNGKRRVKAAPLPQVRGFTDERIRLLVAICREIQQITGANPFLLPTRKAAEILGAHCTQAARWLRILEKPLQVIHLAPWRSLLTQR
jgi:hypothetical protein